MLVRYGQAAMIAAIMTLAGNAVWAQQSGSQDSPSTPGPVYYDAVIRCDKAVPCCKDGGCCSKSKKCDAKCACSKDKKCECCKDGEFGCDKSGKGSCKKTTDDCCPFVNKLAKETAIIMVMPASMPLPAACYLEAMGMLPHPPLPPMPHVCLPVPPIPLPHPIQVHEANTGNVIYGVGVNSNNVCPGYISGLTAAGPSGVVACGIAPPATAAKVRIIATPSSDQLEMTVGEETSIHCKKMTVTIGEKEITVSRFDDRVRIRGEELKATAGSICTDGKDCLILEGNVVLHYKNDGHSANVTGDRIELNLSDSAMTIERAPKIPPAPSISIERIDIDSK
ncbi:MAG TPA: hypothetical protein VMF69_02635 [Gemmataceae bacterium]|nr:hypothetical protein [Gemmataceae bacterium]